MKNIFYLFWAYNVIWAGIAGYLLFLHLRLRRLDRRIDNAEGRLPSESERS